MQEIIELDVYNDKNFYLGKKKFYSNLGNSINAWRSEFLDKTGGGISLNCWNGARCATQ